MRIERLVLESFGAFNGRSVEFGRGLNVFFGENEDGKSTLIDGIFLTLVGAPANTERRRRYAPLNGGEYKAVLYLETRDGRRLRIERDLSPKGHEQVGLLAEGKWVVSGRRDSPLDDLDLPSFDLARATAVITGAEVVLAGRDAETVGRAISAKATGDEGTVSARQALNRLQQRRVSLENKERKVLEDELQEWRREDEELKRAMAAGRQLDEEKRLAAERLAEARRIAAECRPAVEAYDRLLQARGIYEDAARRHSLVLADLQSVRRKEEEIAGIEREMAPFLPCAGHLTHEILSRCRQLAGTIQARRETAVQAEEAVSVLQKEIESARERIGVYRRAGFTADRLREIERIDRAVELAQKNLDDKEDSLSRLEPSGVGKPLVPVLSGLLAAAGAIIGILGFWPGWLAACAAVAFCFVSFMQGKSARTRIEEARVLRDKARGEVELARAAFFSMSGGRDLESWRAEYETARELEEEIAAKEREYRAIGGLAQSSVDEEKELAALLSSAGCSSQAELERKNAALQELRHRLDEARSVRDSIMRGEDFSLWEAKELELAREESTAGAVLRDAETRAAGLDPAAIALYRERLGALDMALLEKQFTEAEASCAQHVKSGIRRDPWEVETGLTLAESALAENRKRAVAVRLAIELLEGAIEEVQANLIPRIESEAGKTFSRLTGGRYEGLDIRPGADMLCVEPRLQGRTLPPYSLSSGTADQMYLALRLALVKALQGREPLPLILDDPFLTFDRPRLRQAVGLLREISRSCQVILVTKDDYLRGLCAQESGGEARIERLPVRA